jgi:glucose/arabinose dehydrogenase
MPRLPARLAPVLLPVLLVALAGCGGPDQGGSSHAKTVTTGSSSPASTTASGSAAAAPPKIALHKVGQFDKPVLAISVPGTDQVAVVEQPGTIRVVDHMTCAARDNCPRAVVKTGAVVLDLTKQLSHGNEQGLLGLAFHPDWPTDPRIFIDFTDAKGTTHVEAWTMAGPTARAVKQQTLLEIPQPFANHNGGNVLFGPDGLLYIGMGDGGDGGDPGDRAQSPGELLGKLLRIDVDGDSAKGYTIPEGNLAGGAPEVWALGLRNPWRYSFDSQTGALWIGDVGQEQYEEVDAITKAGLATDGTDNPNFGWRLREGFSGYDDSGKTGPGVMTGPVLDYSHEDAGCSISGGIVYRGAQLPELRGYYLFADYCSDQLRLVRADGVPGSKRTRGSLKYTEQQGAAEMNSFGAINGGELLVTATDGSVYQVVGAGS